MASIRLAMLLAQREKNVEIRITANRNCSPPNRCFDTGKLPLSRAFLIRRGVGFSVWLDSGKRLSPYGQPQHVQHMLCQFAENRWNRDQDPGHQNQRSRQFYRKRQMQELQV